MATWTTTLKIISTKMFIRINRSYKYKYINIVINGYTNTK